MSNDWIEHNGGPQPVGDDVWVEVLVAKAPGFDVAVYQQQKAASADWPHVSEYRILNQHLIDAKQVEIDAARLAGIRLGLWAAEKYNRRAFDLIVDALRNTNPETIAREADQ